jgi:periplasmic protein CpxP/Spy
MTGRMKKVMATAAVAVVVVAGGASVFAQADRDGRWGRGFGGHRFGRMGGDFGLPLRGLDLTAEQRTQVRNVFEQHRDELRKVHERVRAAFKAQNDAVTAIPPDESAIRAKSADVAAAQAEAAVLRARIHGEVYQILTPEQQQKAKELRAERQQRMQERRQRFEERRQQRQQAPPKQ